MALIKSFKQIPAFSGRLHRTEVDCGYAVFDHNGHAYLQLDTYGSNDRQIPGKVSQTLQLDAKAARALVTLISTTFPGL